MADVTAKVAQIRTAVLGLDVRESIAGGIEDINTEVVSTTAKQTALETTFDALVINAGSSNAEVVAARGSAVSLPVRLSGVDAQLAETTSQLASTNAVVTTNTTAITTNTNAIAGIGNGSPKGVYTTLALLQSSFPTGTTGIYIVTADGKWYYWNGSAWTAGAIYQQLMNTETGSLGMFVSTTAALINFNDALKQIIIPAGVILQKKGYYGASGATVDVSAVYTDGQKTAGLLYNIVSNTYSVVKYYDNPSISDNAIFLAVFSIVGGVLTNISCISEFVFNGLPRIADKSILASKLNFNNGFFGLYIATNGVMNFDDTLKQIVIGQGYILFKKDYYGVPATTLDISLIYTTAPYTGGLYYNVITNVFSCVKYYDFPSISDNDILIAMFQCNQVITNVTCCSDYTINTLPPATIMTLFRGLNLANDRLVLPKTMYFVKGKPIQIFKSSILANDINNKNTKAILTNTDVNNNVTMDYFESLRVSGENLNATFEIGLEQFNLKNNFYYRTIANVTTDPVSITQNTPKIIALGDSLTNFYAATYLKAKLIAMGLNPTMLGTYNDVGGTPAEGRGGWSYQNYVGLSNQFSGGVITPSTSGVTVTNMQNPFLKIATVTDTTNHPTWCFRNTGALTELSYATDADKTGTFWIFDITAYLANHGIANPDIITIALSTNDYGQSGYTLGIANCSLSLAIMYAQIKAALPTCKIGVIPCGTTSAPSTADFVKFFADWTDICQTYVNGLADVNFNIIPTWVSMNKYWIFPYNTATNPVANSNMQLSTIADGTHWGDRGRYQAVAVVLAWVVSKLV